MQYITFFEILEIYRFKTLIHISIASSFNTVYCLDSSWIKQVLFCLMQFSIWSTNFMLAKANFMLVVLIPFGQCWFLLVTANFILFKANLTLPTLFQPCPS